MDLQGWVGREERAEDEISPRLVSGFCAMFEQKLVDGIAPLGIHWCLAPPAVAQSGLGADGHPARGGFLPPVPLPRRMWAGGALKFHRPLRVGDRITRHSRIAAVTQKQGSSGELCFVAVDHEIFSGSGLVIEERQDIVYRAAPSGILEIPIAVKPAAVTAPWQQAGRADPVMLFRYSALTFNSHRIHYDRDYATGVEHYQGLVVHGPLQATWLLDFAARCGGVRPATFSFRGLSALIDLDSFGLHARPVEAGLELWIETAGRRTMQAFAGY